MSPNTSPTPSQGSSPPSPPVPVPVVGAPPAPPPSQRRKSVAIKSTGQSQNSAFAHRHTGVAFKSTGRGQASAFQHRRREGGGVEEEDQGDDDDDDEGGERSSELEEGLIIRPPPPPSQRASSPSAASRGESSRSRARKSTPTKRHRPGQLALKEIKKYQNSITLLIPAAPFRRCVRELMKEMGVDYQVQGHAFVALQEAAECYMINKMENANLCAIHAKRVTIQPRDLQLTTRLMGDDAWGRQR